MSVSGSLEDLSFPDILQIVHVSRQSGTLVLVGPEGERSVRFRNGLVCGASLGQAGPELEDLLVKKGVVAEAFLAPACARQALTGESLSTALVALGAVSQETVDRLVRDELRTLLRSLILLQSGDFRFDLENEKGPRPAAPEGLRPGLEPEAILEGVPLLSVSPQRGAGKTVSGEPARPDHVLLVTDRSSLRLALRDEFMKTGLQVTACAGAAPALDRARSLVARGVSFDLVCELILPEARGVGWRAGLDLIREMRALRPQLRALVLGEVRHPSAADAARSAGASDYLPLPDLGSVGVAEVGDRITEFCGRVCATLCRTDQPAAVRGRRGNGSVRVSDPLSLLRGLIGEMHSEQHSEIALLVLRLAAEYFERGVLFALENGQAYGIGAFGPEAERGSSALIEQRIRGAVLPLSEGSMLHDSVRSRATLQGPVPPKPANAPLLDRLGPPAPVEAALLPLLSGSEVFGLLFGDNPRSGRPVGDLKALEIFLSQAGMALQNALLKRRLGDLPAPDDARTGSERTNT